MLAGRVLEAQLDAVEARDAVSYTIAVGIILCGAIGLRDSCMARNEGQSLDA